MNEAIDKSRSAADVRPITRHRGHAVFAATLIITVLLQFSCSSTGTSGTAVPPKSDGDGFTLPDHHLFSKLYDSLKDWPGLAAHEYVRLRSDIGSSGFPSSAALYQSEDRDGYLYVTHISGQVAIAYLSPRLEVRDVKAFSSELGFSACWKQGLILTLHKHPKSGSYIDTKVFVKTDNRRIDLQYDIK